MTTVKEIAREYDYCMDELPEIFEMVSRIIELAAETLEIKEPHAVNAIGPMKDLSRELSDFEGFLEGNHLKEAA